jgi:hypothetical protein
MRSERQKTAAARAYVLVRKRELRAKTSREGPRRAGAMVRAPM